MAVVRAFPFPRLFRGSTGVAALLLILAVCLLPAFSHAATDPGSTARAAQAATVVIYTRDGCSRCADAKVFLAELARERPALQVVERRVDLEPEARAELARLARERAVPLAGVPTFVIQGLVLVGFEDANTTGARIRVLLDAGTATELDGGASFPAEACSVDETAPCDPPGAQSGAQLGEIETSLFGRLSASRLGLPLFTIALGLLDGFNPCAMWVLLFLLAMLAGQRDRKRLAVTGGTFVLASGVVYYAFMAAWLNVFLILGVSRVVQIALGAVALAVGALNTKDFFAFRRGPSLSIPESAKPGIYARVRAVLHADTLMASALGVALLAVLVNVVELLCTAGFPAVYTSVLAQAKLSTWQRAAYLGLYNLAYVADDALVVSIAIVTLSRRRLSETAGRWLKLASGVVMLGLGALLLVAPERLL
jgi:glutaredoxin